MYSNKCTCCGKRVTIKARNTPYKVGERTIYGVFECPHCNAILGQCYKGDSYAIVLPYWSKDANTSQENWRYFDLQVLGSEGVNRRHGWFNVEDRKILQTG